MNVGNVVVFSNYFLDMLYLFVWRLPRINKVLYLYEGVLPRAAISRGFRRGGTIPWFIWFISCQLKQSYCLDEGVFK